MGGRNTAADGSKPGDWWCPQCGNLVFGHKTQCGKCGYSGQGIDAGGENKGKPGDWQCQCGNLVFSSKEICGKCGAHRSTATRRVGMKPGDWECPNCGDLCFATKDKCKMCGTPKTVADGKGGRQAHRSALAANFPVSHRYYEEGP